MFDHHVYVKRKPWSNLTEGFPNWIKWKIMKFSKKNWIFVLLYTNFWNFDDFFSFDKISSMELNICTKFRKYSFWLLKYIYDKYVCVLFCLNIGGVGTYSYIWIFADHRLFLGLIL